MASRHKEISSGDQRMAPSRRPFRFRQDFWIGRHCRRTQKPADQRARPCWNLSAISGILSLIHDCYKLTGWRSNRVVGFVRAGRIQHPVQQYVIIHRDKHCLAQPVCISEPVNHFCIGERRGIAAKIFLRGTDAWFWGDLRTSSSWLIRGGMLAPAPNITAKSTAR
jgi:hypothetical protein